MRLRFLYRDFQTNQRSALHGLDELDLPAEQLRPFPHRDQTNARPRGVFYKSCAVVFDLKLQRLSQEAKPHPGFASPGVASQVIQSLLQDAVNMNTHATIHR